MIMHGPQSREGSSGGESSGDEADLDRLEHVIEMVPFWWMVINPRKTEDWVLVAQATSTILMDFSCREVQESLCGLGRNSRSNIGSRSNSRGNPSNSRGNQLASQGNILPPQGNLLPSQSNLLASQSNLGSLSSFHSAVTRQVSQFDFCPFAVFFFNHFQHSVYITGLLQPRRHCLLVELPEHEHSSRLERHGEFLQHRNVTGLSQQLSS